jgi:hypothetical protein
MRASMPSGWENRLLAHLAPRARRALVAQGEVVELAFGQVLAEPDAAIGDVYFPLAGFVSLMVPAESGASLEVGLIGAEGMLGATLVLDVGAPRRGRRDARVRERAPPVFLRPHAPSGTDDGLHPLPHR